MQILLSEGRDLLLLVLGTLTRSHKVLLVCLLHRTWAFSMVRRPTDRALRIQICIGDGWRRLFEHILGIRHSLCEVWQLISLGENLRLLQRIKVCSILSITAR